MINLKDTKEIRSLQTNMRPVFESPEGKEVMRFLEQICGWYDFSEVEPNLIQIKHGKRQVLATIKTLLECTPEQVIQLTGE